MKILNLLASEDVTTTDKLEAVKQLVDKVRKTYGNSDVDIPAAKVQTVDGHMSIALLSDIEKVTVATIKLKEVISMTSAIAENTEGALFDRVFEGFVAVDATLANLSAESDSAY